MSEKPFQDIVMIDTDSLGDGTGISEPLSGFLWAICLEYHDSSPGTTQVVVTEQGGAERTFLNVTDNSDECYLVRSDTHNSDGTTTGEKDLHALVGHKLLITVSNGGELEQAVTVRIQVKKA